MTLAPADFAILLVAAAAAVFGLFVGFSGSLAFLAGVVASALTVKFGLQPLSSYFTEGWLRGLAALLLAIIAFGVARAVVRRVVHRIVAQPGDAILGLLVAGTAGALVAVGVAYAVRMLGIVEFGSSMLDAFLPLVAAGA